MAKIHVVKEMFSLDGRDYPRGTEMTDPALIEKVRARFPKHVLQHHHDAPEPAKGDKAAGPAPSTDKAKGA